MTAGNSHESHENNDQEHRHTIEVVVNGRPKIIDDKDLNFTDLVALAFDPVPSGPNAMFTITYRRGQGNKPEGTLMEGQSVRVKDGMIFNVTSTDKS
jgi:hypothetical protein